MLSFEELSQGKIDRPVLKSECSPLLLAIKENNPEAFKDILENDGAVNLRESLQGPIYQHQPDNGQWNYTFQFASGDLTVPFSNLGLALLCDSENDLK